MDAGITQFYNGNYSEAINTLNSAISVIDKCKEPDLYYNAYFYSGCCYYMLENKNPAKNQFKEAIKIKPYKELDPEIIAPKIINFYEEVKQEVFKEKAQIKLLLGNFWNCIQPKKSSSGIEYQDVIKKLNNRTLNEKVKSPPPEVVACFFSPERYPM